MPVHLVRRTHDAHELAVIEPIETARVAAIDNDAAATKIKMSIHRPMALRTIDLSPQFVRRGSLWSRDRIALLRSQLLDQVEERAHRDEHAAALPAGLEPDAREG